MSRGYNKCHTSVFFIRKKKTFFKQKKLFGSEKNTRSCFCPSAYRTIHCTWTQIIEITDLLMCRKYGYFYF